MKLLNALSLNMIREPHGSIRFRTLTLEEARAILSAGFESSVGHADTASVMGSQLGMEVQESRTTITLRKGDRAIVGQYNGPRLPAGTKSLPDDASIVWYAVEVV